MPKRPARNPLSLVEFVIMMALLMACVAMSTDVMLPAFGVIQKDLNILNMADLQYVVYALFAGMSFGQVFFGPLSDQIGRKRSIYLGVGIFILSSLVCATAEDMKTLLLGRVFQGLGIAAPRVVAVAMIRDLHSGREMAKINSIVSAVFIFVPMLAPQLGQVIVSIGDWRMIFAVLIVIILIGVIWMALRQPETLPTRLRIRIRPKTLRAGFIETFTHPSAMPHIIAQGFVFAPFVAYLGNSHQLIANIYQRGPSFSYWFALLAAAIGFAFVFNAFWVVRFGMRRLSVAAAAASGFCGIAVYCWTGLFAQEFSFLLLMVWLCLSFFCLGILFSNLVSLSMDPLGHIAGIASAASSSLSTLIALPLGILMGNLMYTDTAILALGFGLCGIATMLATQHGNRHYKEIIDA